MCLAVVVAVVAVAVAVVAVVAVVWTLVVAVVLYPALSPCDGRSRFSSVIITYITDII